LVVEDGMGMVVEDGMGIFQLNKKQMQSGEYLELKKEVDSLRISLESLRLSLDLYQKKLRVRAKLDKEEDEENINKVIIPER